MKRVLVTGGSGFVGTNLVEYFSRPGITLANFDIRPPRNPAHYSCWQRVDIRDSAVLLAEMNDFYPDQVIHCAARTDLDEKDNLDGYSANIDGVCHLIEAVRNCATVERVIFFSSQLVCKVGYTPKDENDYQPSTLYGRSKAIGEKIVRTAGDFGPTWTIVRPTSLWGPWFAVPYRNFFNAIAHGLYVHPGRKQTHKQWGYVGNAVYQVNCLLGAPALDVHGKTFYLADYDPIPLREFAGLVQKQLNAPPVHDVPYRMLRAAALTGDMLSALGWRTVPLTSFRLNNIVADELQNLEPLEKVVGPLPFSLNAGIERTVTWLRTMEGQP